MEDNRNNGWNQEEELNLSLLDIWHLIWDHKWWYVLSVFFCLVAAAFYIYRTPNIYNRTAKVIIDEGAEEAAMRDLSAFTGSMASRRFSTNVDNEVEALSSPDLMQKVVERLGLETSYFEHQPLRLVELGPDTPIEMKVLGDNPQSSFSFELGKISETEFQISDYMVKGEKLDAPSVKGRLDETIQTPVGKLLISKVISNTEWDNPLTISWCNSKTAAKAFTEEMTVAISGKQTSVVVFTIKDKFPTRAESILLTLIDVYDEAWIHNKNRSARSTTSFINDRLVVIEQELGGIESDLKNYKERHNLTDIKSLGDTYLQESSQFGTRAFEVNNQLSIATYIRDYLNNPTNALSLIPSNSGLTNSNVESQISEYNNMLLERDRLLSSSTEKNPLVMDLNNSLASMRSSILRSIDNLISTLELENGQIKNQEDLILKKMASSTGQEFELLSIERQQKVKESLYIYLLQKREENEIASLVNVSNTRLIMAPNGATNPVEPRKMVIMLLAMMLGCAIPFGIFFLEKMLDTTVAYKGDVTSVLTMPFLAELPQVKKKQKKGIKLPKFKKTVEIDDTNRRIMVKAGKRNAINEAFRVLRTNVDMMLATAGDHKVVMTTSLYPGSGKTVISLNMAASMAVKGSKTLLIDLDLRKASLSEAVGTKKEGVATYLNGTTTDIISCIDNIQENLDILKVGTIPPNPSELLLSQKFKDMIALLKEQYDYIFLDCPPVEIVVDSAIITSIVDMTIFVVRSGLMDKRNLPFVEELYQSEKYNRMAVVLNAVPTEGVKYGSYGRYGYGSGYGYGYGYTYGSVYGESDNED